MAFLPQGHLLGWLFAGDAFGNGPVPPIGTPVLNENDNPVFNEDNDQVYVEE